MLQQQFLFDEEAQNVEQPTHGGLPGVNEVTLPGRKQIYKTNLNFTAMVIHRVAESVSEGVGGFWVESVSKSDS